MIRRCALLLTLLAAFFAISSWSRADAVLPQAASAAPTQGEAMAKAHVEAAYGSLPLSFEINEGQTDASVDFLTRGSGYSLFLSGGEATLALRTGSDKTQSAAGGKDPSQNRPTPIIGGLPSPLEGEGPGLRGKARADEAATPLSSSPSEGSLMGDAPDGRTAEPPQLTALKMRFPGANLSYGIGEEPLPGTVNYFIGNDPAQWHTNIHTYAKVRYQDVYPGIDLVYYGKQGQLEYDFVVAPGANPSQIVLGFDGGGTPTLDAEGNLLLHIAGGDLHLAKPGIYQEMNGKRNAVAGGYVPRNDQTRFDLGAYDATRPLVIDPGLVYSTYLGGGGNNKGQDIAVDGAGDAYVTGWTYSATFPTTPGAFQRSFGGYGDAFVAKLNPGGSALLYATYLGGSDEDVGNGIVVDGAGNAYVTGWTTSTGFPTTPGALQSKYSGNRDNIGATA
ncbi:MAG: SBBP repeat-containing protein, partial [Dehalococcoidia bacterium]